MGERASWLRSCRFRNTAEPHSSSRRAPLDYASAPLDPHATRSLAMQVLVMSMNVHGHRLYSAVANKSAAAASGKVLAPPVYPMSDIGTRLGGPLPPIVARPDEIVPFTSSHLTHVPRKSQRAFGHQGTPHCASEGFMQEIAVVTSRTRQRVALLRCTGQHGTVTRMTDSHVC